MKSITLSNGKLFKSKKDAKEHFKAILYRYGDDETISDPADHSDLCALVERFDELVAGTVSKSGGGIAKFERRMNRSDGWKSPGFWIIRVDGSDTDMSFIKAIDGVPKSPEQEFYDACHNTVFPDLAKLKQRQFDHFADEDGKIECDITGVKVGFADANLSHANPQFNDIVLEYRATKGWSGGIPDGVLTKSGDKQLSTHFSATSVAEEFRRFHHGRAVLRIISKSRPSGSRNAPVKKPLKLTV